MSGLKLGDLILDPRRVVYIPSLRALVCAGLLDALGIGISGGLRGVIERVDATLQEYKPEFFVILGSIPKSANSATSFKDSGRSPSKGSYEAALTGIARRWGKRAKIQLVATSPSHDARAVAEALNCEVHNELVWGRYRFVEKQNESNMELQLMTIAGSPNYGIRVGNRTFAGPFGGVKLAVYLKGLGRLTLPSMDPSAALVSVFKAELERCDVFAVGHQRVLPMGKVGELKPYKGIVRGVPISKITLGARKRAPKEPLADS